MSDDDTAFDNWAHDNVIEPIYASGHVNEDDAVGDVRDAPKAELIRLHTTLDEIRDAVGADPGETTMQAIHELAAEWDRARVLVRRLRLAWRSARRGRLAAREELAAVRASAVVLPEPVQRLVDWHLSYDGLNVSPLPFQSEVREAMKSWRPTTVEAAPTAGIALADELWPTGAPVERVEWCVFYGGTDPYDSAGIEFYDDEADATEKIQWYEQPAGVAKRTVRRGPWEVTPAAGVSGTGTEASDGE